MRSYRGHASLSLTRLSAATDVGSSVDRRRVVSESARFQGMFEVHDRNFTLLTTVVGRVSLHNPHS